MKQSVEIKEEEEEGKYMKEREKNRVNTEIQWVFDKVRQPVVLSVK